jgi:hypothetical protein
LKSFNKVRIVDLIVISKDDIIWLRIKKCLQYIYM